MSNKLLGALMILGGAGLAIGSVVVWVLWLTFCFGTVIVGLVILFLAPAVLIAPLVIGGGAGVAMMGKGLQLTHA